jgi:mono/diheme cytochrome c family protein
MERPLPYDPARMNRPIKVLFILLAAAAIAAFATACGTQKISVPQSDPTHRGAVLFNQRCSGCHTLSYAATQGSATNVRTALPTNGPNFNVRCERPITRVLYAIENGGFSGAIMPQNVVVGQDAAAVAQFVAKYAGRQTPKITGGTPCTSQPIGTLPAPGQTATTASPTAAPAAAAVGLASASVAAKAKAKAKATGGTSKRKTARH